MACSWLNNTNGGRGSALTPSFSATSMHSLVVTKFIVNVFKLTVGNFSIISSSVQETRKNCNCSLICLDPKAGISDNVNNQIYAGNKWYADMTITKKHVVGKCTWWKFVRSYSHLPSLFSSCMEKHLPLSWRSIHNNIDPQNLHCIQRVRKVH